MLLSVVWLAITVFGTIGEHAIKTSETECTKRIILGLTDYYFETGAHPERLDSPALLSRFDAPVREFISLGRVRYFVPPPNAPAGFTMLKITTAHGTIGVRVAGDSYMER